MTANAERKLFYGLPWGQLIVVLGPPKTGKSTLAGSMADVVPPERIALLCTKANEANSWLYRKHGLSERAEIFSDAGWDPEMGSFKADGWKRLNKRIQTLTGDKSIDGIIVDSGTDSIALQSHEVLAGMKVNGKIPGDTGDLKVSGAGDAPYAYYGKMGAGTARFMTRLVECAMNADAPKFIIIPWHTQSPSEEEIANAGTTFAGRTLPMLEGRYREKLAGDCDVVVYTDIRRTMVSGKAAVQHVIQVTPSPDRHAAVRAMPMGAEQWLPNEFKALHAALVSVKGSK